MNITQLKYFHAVATYHTVSLAAEHLYISQPSLSNAIKALEAEFSVNLFYRRYNGMFLTPEGTKLYNASKELLIRYDEVRRMMIDIGKGGIKEIRLGIPPMISSVILADIHKNFVGGSNDIKLTVTEKGRYELLDLLNDGLLDVVLLPHTEPFDSDICAKKIGTAEIVCCVARSNPIAQNKTVDAKMLSKQPIVLFADSFFQTKTIKEWFADADVLPQISLQTEQLSTAQGMIESDLAVGFMFRSLVRKNRELKAVSLAPKISVDISVLRKKDTYVSDGIKRLESYLMGSNSF